MASVYPDAPRAIKHIAHGHKHLNTNEQYIHALDVLRGGGLVAMPTDTVYGLIAVAGDDAAVQRLYEVKQRDPAQALPLFVGSLDQCRLIAVTNDVSDALAAAFWPGALTIVLAKREAYGTRAAAGGDTIAVRLPGDAALREIALQLGPLTGTSANRAGQPECHTAAQVRAQLGDDVDLIVDAPIDATGVASTIIDCTDASVPQIIRVGAIATADIERVLGRAVES